MIFIFFILSIIKFDEIPIADLIQAIGALIAIIAAIYSFIKLFKKDEDKQKQIDSLVKLAQESSNQTRQLIEQTNHMQKLNNLYEEQLVILRKSSEITISSHEDSAKEREIQNKIRKIKNAPKFVYQDAGGNRNLVSITFTNQGERAEIISINHSMPNMSLILKGNKKIVSNKESFIIDVKSLIGGDLFSINLSFSIVYKDIEGNSFEQVVTGIFTSIKLADPKEI